jgi:hypothetical protein
MNINNIDKKEFKKQKATFNKALDFILDYKSDYPDLKINTDHLEGLQNLLDSIYDELFPIKNTELKFKPEDKGVIQVSDADLSKIWG